MSATVFDWRAGATILMRSCRGKLLRIVGSSLVTGWLVCLATNIYGQDNQTNDGNVAQAASADETPEQQRERITAERFLTVLLRRPTRGTSLDRVFSYHIGRGDIGELIEGLDDEAETQTDEAAKARYKMVVGLLQSQRGEDAKAVEAFQAATRLTPDDPYAANYLGEALLLVGQESEATEAFANALANDPPKQEYLKIAGALGRLYQRSGQQAEAVAVWKQLEQAFPGDQRVLERIAHILVEEGDLDAALKRFDALAEEARSDNDKIVYAMRAAEFRIRAGDRDQAIKEIERLLSRLRPGSYLHGEARRKIESAFLSSADYAGLASYYEQWVDDHPDDIDATVRLARTLSAQGRTPEAIEWFEQAIERAPSESAPRLALIDAYVAAERYSDAATQYETLTKNDPDNPDHLVHWGQVILQDKDRDADQRAQAAAKVWMRLADARSDDAVVQSQVADLMRNAKLEEQALQRYRAAIKLAPQEPQYKEYLGEYLYRLNRKDEAYEVWQSLAEGELRTRKNLVRLAEILHQFERESDAITVMSEACQMDPTIEERIRFAEWLRDDQQFDPSLEQIKLASDLAETLEDAERVFNEEVKTYQAAGKLQDRIDQLQSNVADSPSDATAWRRLAMLFNANRNAREATDAIEKAIELAPDSIDNLVISAQMYEDAGRLHQAINKRRKLADTDTRFRSGHLQKLASIYLQVGEPDQSLAVGDELLASSGGSVESFRFYADLCGRLGKSDLRLDSLRRCVRMNPRSVDAQQMLAEQLAEDFKTDQAIELYWQILEGKDDLESQRKVVAQLANLYLRTNRLDQLVTRLEIRGREMSDRRTAVDLTATAYAEVGDVGLAKQTLEGLLQESGRDTMLMQRLVELSQQAGELDEALSLQRQLTQLSPDRNNEAMLATLLLDTGATKEAEAIWMKIAESENDSKQLRRNLNRLFDNGEPELAIKLVNQALKHDPRNWELLLDLTVFQATSDQWEDSAKTAERLISLDLPEETLPEGGKPYPTTQTYQGQTYPNPPIRYVRVNGLYPLLRLVDSRYGSSGNPTLPTPMDYGQAKVMAQYCKLHYQNQEGLPVETKVHELVQNALKENATSEEVWDAYQKQLLYATATQQNSMNYQNPSDWPLIWKVAEKVPASGDYALGVLLNTRSSNYKQRELQLQPLSQERLDWLKNRADNQHSAMATSLQHPLLNWHAFYVAELEIAQQDEAAKEYAKRLVEVTSQKIREENLQEYELLQAVELISLYGTDDQLWDAIETALRTEGSRPTNNAGNRLASLLSRFANPQRVSDGLSKGVANSNYRQRLFEISDTLIAQYADQPLRHRTISLTGTGGPRNSYQLINGNYRSIVIEFPPQGLGPDDEMIRVCHQVWESLDKEDAVDEWIAAIETSLTSSADSGKAEKPAKSVWQRVFLACVLQWDGQTSRASELIEEAIAIAQDATPQLDAELRLLSADLKLRAGQQTQALDTIDAISVYDRQTMAIREFAAAKLSAAIGNVERARVAARRLFGVRLSASAQIELAKLMSSLGMQDLATDLVRRMRSRGGSTPDELESVMRFYFSQQETELASEVAMELLRRNVNVSRNTRNRTTANAQRLSALQTLAKTGKLTALIEQTEQRLENAPQSTRIRVELAEMYEAIGQKQKSLALMSSADTDSVTSFTALIDTARQFAQAGNHDAACDAYLKAFRTNQSSFSNDFYEIIQPFEHQQRLSDLAEMMVEVGVQKFDRYRVSEVCNRLVRSESHLDDARKFFEAILDSIKSVPGQQSQSFDNLSGYLPRYLKSESTMRKLTETLIEYSKLDRGFTRLFSGYSTSQDGEHNNMVTTFTRFLQKNPEQLNYVIERVRQASEENDQWASGRLWLGMLYTADKQFDEANVLFDQAIASKGSDQLSYNGLWLVASYIDQFDPLKPTAERFYEHALTVPSNYRTSDFQYTLESRYCNFLKDNGNAEKARQIALSTLNSADSEPRIVGNNDYEAYRRISNTMSLMQFFKELGYPADGLRIARDLDRSLFDKASRYGSNASLENFEKVQSELIKQVQEQGGVDGLRSLIALKDDQKPAIDFLISQGTNPFTQDGLTSIWLDMARSATNKTEDEQTAKLTTFVEELHELAKERPDDQSLSTAIALIECMRGDLSVLRTQLNTWTGSGTDQTTGSQITKDQRNLLTLMASQILLKAKEQDQQLLMQAFEIALEGSANDDCFVLAELGKAFLQRGDLDAAQASWMRAVDRDVDQWLLLDLSTAAIEHEMAELSAAAFDAAIEAPKQTLGFDALSKGVSSLGELLGTASSSTSSAVSNASVTLNGADIRQAQQMMKLDEAWRKHNMPTSKIFDPYVRLVFPQAKEPHVLMVEHQAGQDQSVFVDSVLALLAQRAHDTNQSDVLLEHVSADTPQNNLIATLILLLDDQGIAAKKRLSRVKSDSINSMARFLPLHVLPIALEYPETREQAAQLCLALIEANRPTERYADVSPFDALSYHLAKVCLDRNVDGQLASKSINLFLEISNHDNMRYSDLSSQLRRRQDQIERVARLLLPKGMTAEALLYLGMRDEAFNAGLDTSLDWVGCWALESIQGMQDRAVAYHVLADWTFNGDGGLNRIQTLARRQPLPDWIPPSVGGHYPPFPPVADPYLPIATNYYFLARLAQETGMRQDLLDRLYEAYSKGRAGADVALASALAEFEMPIEANLIQEIEDRLKASTPVFNGPKFRVPLAEFQLASQLANRPEFEAFVERTTEHMLAHTQAQSRGFLMPWISRYQWKHGWATTSSWTESESLRHWSKATLANAHDRYEGKTPAIWVADEKGELAHVAGYGMDYLWLKYPLQGNFTIEYASDDGGWSESSVIVDGLNLFPNASSGALYVCADGEREWVRHFTQKLKKNTLNECQVVRDDQHTSFLANGQLFYQEARHNSTPFVGFGCNGDKRLIVHNIKISGQPTIPREVDLIAGGDLRGWSGSYFDADLPSSDINMEKRDNDAGDPRAVRQRPSMDDFNSLAWTIKEKELVSGGSGRHGYQNQQCLQYQRPLCNGETLSYEFYYQPGKFEAHPTIGRVAYMLREDGCKLHWMSTGSTSWSIPPDYEVAASDAFASDAFASDAFASDAPGSNASARPISLKPGDWNRVEITRNGVDAVISVNGEVIFEGEPLTRDGTMVFGFFHNAEQTKTRIRNVKLTGDWPEQLPENLFETIAN